MPAGYLDCLHRCRRPLIAVAVALIWLQAVVAGIAAAHSFSLSDALSDQQGFDLGVICHGAGGDATAEGVATDAPDTTPHGKAGWNLCCTFCTAVAAATVPSAPTASEPIGVPAIWLRPLTHQVVVVPLRAIRAGPSQAPPHSA